MADADAPTQPTTAEWPRCALERCCQPFRPGTGRGPDGSVCSRNQCRNHLYGVSGKAKEVAELKARLAEKDALIASQADLIAALKVQLLQSARPQLPAPPQPALQEPPHPPVAPPETAEACRPALRPIDTNVAAAAPPPAKRAKPAEAVARPPAAPPQDTTLAPPQQSAPPPQPPPASQPRVKGWIRGHNTTTGKQWWRLQGSRFKLYEQPAVMSPGGRSWHFHHDILANMVRTTRRPEYGEPPSQAALREEYERMLGMQRGSIASSASHTRAWQVALERAEKEWAADSLPCAVVAADPPADAGVVPECPGGCRCMRCR